MKRLLTIIFILIFSPFIHYGYTHSSTMYDNRYESSEIDTQSDNYYEVCTSLSKNEVEDFGKQVRDAVLQRDWNKLATMAVFPLRIGKINYSDAKSLKGSNLSFGNTFYENLRMESCKNMFHNYHGIMLGNGEIWFGEVEIDGKPSLKIIAINGE